MEKISSAIDEEVNGYHAAAVFEDRLIILMEIMFQLGIMHAHIPDYSWNKCSQYVELAESIYDDTPGIASYSEKSLISVVRQRLSVFIAEMRILGAPI